MARRTNRELMRMVFYCAKGYQEDLVAAQTTKTDRIREQRDLAQIKRMEKLIMGSRSRTLGQALTDAGCPTMTIDEIKELMDSGEIQSNK